MSVRRVVRSGEKQGPDALNLPKNSKLIDSTLYQRICSVFLKVLHFSWGLLQILWYWFERVFLVTFLIVLTVGLAWWLSQKPSLYRDWERSDMIQSEITWSGDLVLIDNMRNHIWTSDTAFSPNYLRSTFNLSDIENVYYIITPFSQTDGPAHTMFSFTFSGGQHVVISPEIRKERGERFSAVNGLLNQYELQYVIGTENDLIKLRTDFRKNEVYMYPLRIEKETASALFRSLLIRADKLNREPEFYNTFWNNCATSLLFHANSLRIEKIQSGKYFLFPSHSDELLFSLNLIDTQLSSGDARAYYRVDTIARSISGEVNFSEAIRRPIQ